MFIRQKKKETNIVKLNEHCKLMKDYKFNVWSIYDSVKIRIIANNNWFKEKLFNPLKMYRYGKTRHAVCLIDIHFNFLLFYHFNPLNFEYNLIKLITLLNW